MEFASLNALHGELLKQNYSLHTQKLLRIVELQGNALTLN